MNLKHKTLTSSESNQYVMSGEYFVPNRFFSIRVTHCGSLGTFHEGLFFIFFIINFFFFFLSTIQTSKYTNIIVPILQALDFPLNRLNVSLTVLRLQRRKVNTSNNQEELLDIQHVTLISQYNFQYAKS